jgi:hydroxymethylpyrimidine pyrophosphatase-like HAD family hydrolase
MRYHVLATDYDGTLAHDGHVDETTLEALKRLLASGRKLILVTGRTLDEVLKFFADVNFCDQVVAENGALVYQPAGQKVRVLCEPPPEELLRVLTSRGVAPLARGHAIVAAPRVHEATVAETIHDLDLEWQVISNRNSVMMLPSGVNKATGLEAALADAGFAADETVGVGDAENDPVFLSRCAQGVAVGNALPCVKEIADFVLRNNDGAGIVELIDQLVQNDLTQLENRKPDPILFSQTSHRTS